MNTNTEPDTDSQITSRAEHAVDIVRRAASVALSYYRQPALLNIRNKGLQDQVSAGDIETEAFIRRELEKRFPDDGIVGEESDEPAPSTSGYTWIIDPVDGTSNYVRGAPGWCVVLACVNNTTSQIAAVYDPIAEECFTAVRGQGCLLNGAPVSVSDSTSLADGSVGVGMSNRVPVDQVVSVIDKITAQEGLFYRNGSGALNLAYVAAGRLSGYCEPHMNAWDCVAAMLLIEEAGGRVEPFDLSVMLADGGRVIAACPGIYDALQSICTASYTSPAAIEKPD